ncbi:prolipoprotein diacylglyceryl transferase [Patescibacteria group bacterium]|nr:prolipoprotein diacylglyceryl transferase [Patescibacteria group bacterium]
MSTQLFGLQLHAYGFILGLAMVVGVLLAEWLIKSEQQEEALFWRLLLATLVGGFVGARIYHVWTDWPLYQYNFEQVLFVWNGGLSILGALLGGAIALCFTLAFETQKKAQSPGDKLEKKLFIFSDIAALCIPISQAIGRVGNYVNQELYGPPTDLPWGIYIKPEHRIAGYEQHGYFHPLFAYEAVGMLIFAGCLWWLRQQRVWKIGQGYFTLSYLAFYGVFRGGLEFLRLEKANWWETSLGLNQVILFAIGGVAVAGLLLALLKRKLSSTPTPKVLGLLAMFCLGVVSVSGCQLSKSEDPYPTPNPLNNAHKLFQVADHSTHSALVRRSATTEPLILNLEVVNTPQSIQQGLSDRSEIGSDGMLFVFPEADTRVFWMLRMHFDLDMIWLKQGRVVGITTDIPHPQDSNERNLPRYSSPTEVDWVLEVPAGSAKKWQLQVGDALELP